VQKFALQLSETQNNVAASSPYKVVGMIEKANRLRQQRKRSIALDIIGFTLLKKRFRFWVFNLRDKTLRKLM